MQSDLECGTGFRVVDVSGGTVIQEWTLAAQPSAAQPSLLALEITLAEQRVASSVAMTPSNLRWS